MTIKFITRVQISQEIESVVNSPNTKMYKVHKLYSMSVPKVQISELLNIRYQMVRNYLLQPYKKSLES